MFRTHGVRTGIDLGWGNAKLVTGRGGKQLDAITHVGHETWDPPDSGDPDLALECEAEAIQRLLRRLGLTKRNMGRIAVSVDSSQASIREVVMPALSDAELQRALPFESRTHLDLERMEFPILGGQILGPAPQEENAEGQGESNRIRVLLAAIPKALRDRPLRVLRRAGLEPQVVDLEPLAGLNELRNHLPEEFPANGAVCLLDLGKRHSAIHLVGREEGLLSRPVGPGIPGLAGSEDLAGRYAALISDRARETIHFYQARHHQIVKRVYLSGGGALVEGIVEALESILKKPVEVLDPMGEMAAEAEGYEEVSQVGPLFVRAFGLCRWGDEHV